MLHPELVTQLVISTGVTSSSSTCRPVGVDLGQGIDTHVAAGHLSLIMLLGQDGIDQAKDRGSVGADTHYIASAPDLPVQALLGLFDQIWRQCSVGKPAKE